MTDTPTPTDLKAIRNRNLHSEGWVKAGRGRATCAKDRAYLLALLDEARGLIEKVASNPHAPNITKSVLNDFLNRTKP